MIYIACIVYDMNEVPILSFGCTLYITFNLAMYVLLCCVIYMSRFINCTFAGKNGLYYRMSDI